MSKININVIFSDVMADRLMHAADLFGPGKVLIIPPQVISGEIKDGVSTLEAITKIRAVLERDQSHYRLIAIWRSEHEEGAWFDPVVVSVSTGYKWGLLRNYLAGFNYPGVLQPA